LLSGTYEFIALAVLHTHLIYPWNDSKFLISLKIWLYAIVVPFGGAITTEVGRGRRTFGRAFAKWGNLHWKYGQCCLEKMTDLGKSAPRWLLPRAFLIGWFDRFFAWLG
jgi:hypothetical protein